MNLTRQQKQKMRRLLLRWYDIQGRALPWRIRPEDRAAGRVADPYAIWLSEVMCQQTRIATVIPYHAKFLAKWPDVQSLASATREQVYVEWAGLGYYARARNLHACAEDLASNGFPKTEKDWLALPGVGPYTAAAMVAIVHGAASNVVDGNVERVMARLFAVQTPLPKAKSELSELAAMLVTRHRAQDYPQALMDLGAVVCIPKSPKCDQCPWAKSCKALARGEPQKYPLRTLKPKRPEKYGIAFILRCGDQVLLRQRPEKGLLGGMSEVGGTPWRLQKWKLPEAKAHAPCSGNWQKAGDIRHVFTHFALTLRGVVLTVPVKVNPEKGYWVQIDQLDQQALPGLYRKLLTACL